mmetsp:Transcript_19851/g.43428  ORF Transcript_19851/g.43428 Transcript_19851/m.43428 type:complete len:250 (-) Transcript_19851:244-993(-)|eukprot:CAMPEP_0118925108 /NCGR_PEP_ID=MMETSP1169-20130426/3032_1 /TAXON_ID=36882 /ORGANISM="Pyramimonas obovata, Strain CCMP722" /LENGTH=249 /DNA_ID=CAMNT_0006866313 /DNA_START=113 /DNA_END=862 /DNA_ORIENTATION=-
MATSLLSMDVTLVRSARGARAALPSIVAAPSRRSFSLFAAPSTSTAKRTTRGTNVAVKALLGADFSTIADTLGNIRAPRGLFFQQQTQDDDKNTQTKATKTRLLTLVEDYAQAEYDLRQFEEFSGRCAMVALTVAMGLELGMDGHGLFEGLDTVVVSCYSFFAVAAMMSSVQVAAYLVEKGVREGEKFAGYAGKSMATSYHTFQRERAMSLKNVLEPFIDLSLLAIYKDINVTPPQSSPVRVKVEESRE